ncbi:hypothetical protein MRX96_020172 [Rhipicephalus microplus]
MKVKTARTTTNTGERANEETSSSAPTTADDDRRVTFREDSDEHGHPSGSSDLNALTAVTRRRPTPQHKRERTATILFRESSSSAKGSPCQKRDAGCGRVTSGRNPTTCSEKKRFAGHTRGDGLQRPPLVRKSCVCYASSGR